MYDKILAREVRVRNILYYPTGFHNGIGGLYKVVRVNRKSITVEKWVYSDGTTKYIKEDDYDRYVRLTNRNIHLYFGEIFQNDLHNLKVFGRDLAELKTSQFNLVNPFTIFHSFDTQMKSMHLMKRLVAEIPQI